MLLLFYLSLTSLYTLYPCDVSFGYPQVGSTLFAKAILQEVFSLTFFGTEEFLKS